MGSEHINGSFDSIASAAGWLHLSELDPSNFGNISILHRKSSLTAPALESFDVPGTPTQLIDSLLFITRSGSTMKEVTERPLLNIGVYRIEQVSSMSLIYGSGPPSSEIAAHLEIYRAILIDEMAIIHFHDEGLLRRISNILNPPDWIRTIPKLKPGSLDLARASGEAASMNRLLIWRGHGMTAISDTVETAVRIVEAAMAL